LDLYCMTSTPPTLSTKIPFTSFGIEVEAIIDYSKSVDKS
jgi:hypothetical protein